MLRKLASQTAVYGISTIIVRFLTYLLTPYYTRVFAEGAYGIITDVYALIPFALVLLTMGMETSYFRFAAKTADKQRLFATTWGVTIWAATLFFGVVWLLRGGVASAMGEAYVAHPGYVVWVAAIVLLDVWMTIPFCRLREQGRAKRFMALKGFSAVFAIVLNIAFGMAGFFDTSFGVGWVLVANFIASAATLVLLLPTARVWPRIDWRLLAPVLVYSLPLLVSGLAGVTNEFIDRQMIKYLVPDGAMEQVGIYGAIVKVGVVMTLFTQVYRFAAEPFFLADYKKEDFKAMNAAALNYFVLVSMVIFLGIALFKDVFALIVGGVYREGIGILPVVLMSNFLSGVWLNLSFWYKREERTVFAIVVTVAGLIASTGFYFALVPRFGYHGAAWARLVAEGAMVAVSFWLNRRYYPIPYRLRRMAEYVAVALFAFGVSVLFERYTDWPVADHVLHVLLLAGYLYYAIRREKIDVAALARMIIGRKK